MAARVIQDGVNELVKTTILEVEKVLRHLPQKGDKVDVITASGRNEYNQEDGAIRQQKNLSELIIDQQTMSSCSVDRYGESRGLPKAAAHILSDSIRVTHMENMDGMNIDMTLRLKREHSSQVQLVDIRIECPDFKPKRMRIGGRWYNIDFTECHESLHSVQNQATETITDAERSVGLALGQLELRNEYVANLPASTLFVNGCAVLNFKLNKRNQDFSNFVVESEVKTVGDKVREFLLSLQYFRVIIAFWNVFIIFLMLVFFSH
ncbi:unnamed protein product [Cylicocyclus nassatus]|uniref:Uncharacterized protein n=1 Tax=Cylicocyclus nassatus TaxID=53992 RepID=A0AA36HBQ5_CYLNA|nr:unnamed protein product [Cylicocyclus nassatus]